MAADAEVLEDKAGKCPKCGMALQPIRLDLRYGCPLHPTFVQEKPGKHSIDGRDLVPVTLSVSWVCGDHAFLEPGNCPDGRVRTARYAQRPHGDHNPKHGGLFFMAPDGWHHLEGTYPRAGLFRLYFYNDYSKPLPPAGFTATLSILDANDAEVVWNLPLKRGRIANAMEVILPKSPTQLPVRLMARVRFGTGADSSFNFQFGEVTKEPPAPFPVSTQRAERNGSSATSVVTGSAVGTAQPAPGGPAAIPAPSPPSAAALSNAPAALVAAIDESSLPTTAEGLLAELGKRAGELGETVKQGNLADAWLPAMATKTVALALESQTATLPSARRAAASMAIRRIVMSAWDLDAFGDLGNKAKMDQAYRRLASALSDLRGLYERQ
jgi:hypothetical protein